MIQAIAIVVILASLLTLAYRRPNWGFSILVFLIVAVIGSYAFTKGFGGSTQQGIQLADVSIENSQVDSGYAGSYLLRAELRNNATEATLGEAMIRSTLYDCPYTIPKVKADEATPLDYCVQLASEDNIVRVFVPARHTDTIAVSLNVNRLKQPQAEARWQHQVLRVQ